MIQNFLLFKAFLFLSMRRERLQYSESSLFKHTFKTHYVKTETNWKHFSIGLSLILVALYYLRRLMEKTPYKSTGERSWCIDPILLYCLKRSLMLSDAQSISLTNRFTTVKHFHYILILAFLSSASKRNPKKQR